MQPLLAAAAGLTAVAAVRATTAAEAKLIDVFSALSMFAASQGGIVTGLGPVEKSPRNPLFGQDQPWEPRLDNGYPHVMLDAAYQRAGEHRPWRL
jgi:hypothetical protein